MSYIRKEHTFRINFPDKNWRVATYAEIVADKALQDALKQPYNKRSAFDVMEYMKQHKLLED